MVPEKASSFKIHPLRCCSDVCYYCGLKFGMLDTPMHIMQLKTAEIQVTAKEFTGFKGDACLCDKCFRFIDRRAKTIQDRKGGGGGGANAGSSNPDGGDPDDPYYYDSNGGEPQLSMKKCVARNCNREVGPAFFNTPSLPLKIKTFICSLKESVNKEIPCCTNSSHRLICLVTNVWKFFCSPTKSYLNELFMYIRNLILQNYLEFS